MQQDWIFGLAGGLMIGLAGAIFLLVNGRIMGASGLIGGLVDRSGWGNASERLGFLAGLILVPGAVVLMKGGYDNHLTDRPGVIVAAGVLVGVGTRLANGCTSGHGVCGISRLSVRGIVATVTFILAGGAAMLLFRHLLGVI
ncbi:MAG: YeeE/YedE thiosulfate transporter family protein [Paracoccaceae bacterium]|jgi:uncharacterized protein